MNPVEQLWTRATETTVLGTTPARWAAALLATVICYLVLALLLKVAMSRADRLAKRSTNDIDDLLVEVFRSTRRWILVLVALLVGLDMLELPLRWQSRVSQLWFIVIVVQIALWISRGLKLFLHRQLERRANVPESSASATLLSWAVQTALWTIVMLAVLANLGVNITAMVTGLGVGGIAVALAVQNILGDLFASLAIALDKPFEVGDAIATNGISGTVERVGLKTTRLRAPAGEQIVMSNTELLKNALSNYKRQTQRRIAFKFSVSLDTDGGQARAIPDIVKQIVESHDEVRFDRAHLQRITETALEYEVVYIVQSSDYMLYMNVQQDIYLALIDRLQASGISFAQPRAPLPAAPVAPAKT